MKKNNGQGVISGLFWTFSERISAQVVSLIVTIVIARLLDPEHYVPISIVTIFITFANTFVKAGFGNALVQKKNADDLDFSSTFVFSLVTSIVLYFIMFSIAPLVSRYYEDAILTPVLRVMSLRLIIASINSVQHAYVSKQKAFRKFFFSTLGGTLVSAIVGIFMAYKGFGVWALVAQYLTNTIIDTAVLSFTCGWTPSFRFSYERMKGLFSYGWKLLVSDLLTTLYSEIRGIILSAGFEKTELSYYNQGEKYPQLFINNIEVAASKVLFQKLCDEQDDLVAVKKVTRMTIRMSTFLLYPVFFGLAACGSILVSIVLTDKWLPCVPYLQIICITDLIHPIFTAHIRVMKALGDSKTYLITTIIRYFLGYSFIALTLVVFHEPHIVIISMSVALLITTIISAIINMKKIGYALSEQLADFFPTLIIGAIMFVCVVLLSRIHLNRWFVLFVQIVVGAIIYVCLSLLFNKSISKSAVSLVKRFIHKSK